MYILFQRLKRILNLPVALVTLAFGLMFGFATVGFKLTEGALDPGISWLDAAWWALVTMTTVGYGDLAPKTVVGRFLVGYPTLVLGVAFLGYAMSLLAVSMLEIKRNTRKGLRMIKADGHVLIIRFTSVEGIMRVVNEIKSEKDTEKLEIILVDEFLEELPVELHDQGVQYVNGDPAKLTTLKRANFTKARSAIILADKEDPTKSDLKNLAVVLTIESESSGVHTIVECIDPDHIPYFKRAGCDSVLCLNVMAGQIMAQELLDPGITTVIKELTSNTTGKQFYINEIPPSMTVYAELTQHFQTQARTLVAGVRRAGVNHILPEPAMPLEAGDQAILISAVRPSFDHKV